jgi:[protein-PII] uridylyltransferase
VGLAAKDLNILTPMLDARFICGMSMLYTELLNQLREKVVRKHSARILEALVRSTVARHRQYGDSANLLEPHLKEGQGGLRDYHAMLWLARLTHDLHQPRDLEYAGLLSHAEYQALREALHFIWNVRNHLHHLCGRKCDQLHFENQITLAGLFKFKASGGQQAVERFLGELHGRMELVKQQHQMLLHELGLEGKGRRPRRGPKSALAEGLDISASGMLTFTGPEAIVRRPEILMRIFEESLLLKIPLSAESRRLVREFAHLLTPARRNAPETARAFERVLLAPAAAAGVLEDMLTSGMLQAFIPEFSKIANRIQYDEYHLYPVDKHLLRTVQTLQQLGEDKTGTDALYHRVYRELKDRTPLLWAALLHDIGKAESGADHSQAGAETARRIVRDKGMRTAEADTVAFLVREHLYLVKTATRRDILDEETALAAARRIRDIERLKMLFLLSVADSMATGPAAWNDWTAHLLREFFLKVLNVLEKGELASAEAVAAIENKRGELLRSAADLSERRDFEALFADLTPRYLLAVPAEGIGDHLRLFRRMREADFVWDIRPSAAGATRTVTICAKDRPGLVASIAGVFTLNTINILDVQVFTWRNRTALDIFEVTPPPDRIFEKEKWRRAEEQLQSVLSGKLALSEALKGRLAQGPNGRARGAKRPHRVRVDNTSSSFFTIVEVFTYDFPGLLFSVTDALFRCGLDIWVAKIATKVDQVVDAFYVRDIDGQKVDDPHRTAEIRETILQRLPPLE